MRWKYIFNITGFLIFFLSVFLIFPIAVSAYYQDGSIGAFFQAFVLSIAFAVFLLFFFKRPKTEQISTREGIAIVAIGWFVIAFFGCLPFYFSSCFPSFIDCLFESVSGFTTTGASIISEIEALPKAILFWRSLIQWMGGMGIIVLSIAILPLIGVGGMQLYKAEVPSPVPDKITPRVKDTASILWKIYILISVLEVILLCVGGMDFFDSLCHTLTTMPTGGFSTKNISIAHYNSVYFDFVIIFFMILAGINFSMHYQLLKGRPLAFWKDSECRFFLLLIFVLVIIVTINIYGSVYENIIDAFRYSSFQVVSMLTTTGYATADYELWPYLSQILIFSCMFIGATAGSTGGGMKCIRIMLCFKYCCKELDSLVHPKSVSNIKLGGKVVSPQVISGVMGFLALYIGVFVVCTILFSALGPDLLTSMSAVASAIGNIGPGLGSIGPTENYAHLPQLGKLLLAGCMLIGRLEIYTVLIFFVPEFWKK